MLVLTASRLAPRQQPTGSPLWLNPQAARITFSDVEPLCSSARASECQYIQAEKIPEVAAGRHYLNKQRPPGG